VLSFFDNDKIKSLNKTLLKKKIKKYSKNSIKSHQSNKFLNKSFENLSVCTKLDSKSSNKLMICKNNIEKKSQSVNKDLNYFTLYYENDKVKSNNKTEDYSYNYESKI
jgi:hypothetical protein